MAYLTDEEKHKLKFRFRDCIELEDAAEICLISPARLKELTESGFAPAIMVDNSRFVYKRKEIFEWAKANLVQHLAGKPIPKTITFLEHRKADPFGIPEELTSLHSQLKEVFGDGIGPCVYFLILKKEIVYVGQSVNLMSRVDSHRLTKEFDRTLYLPIPKEILNDVEAAFIRKLRPKYNLSQANGKFELFHQRRLEKIGYLKAEAT
jgi:hypothetical protein